MTKYFEMKELTLNDIEMLAHRPVRRIAMLSVHTCPLAMMGGKKTGGMNVYVRDLAVELGRFGVQVDVFTRSEDDCQPRIKHDLGHGARVIHIKAGPEIPAHPTQIISYLDDFVAGVMRFADEEGADYQVIHSHYWLSGLVAEKLRVSWERTRGHRIPIIQMFHTLGYMKNKIQPNPEEQAPQARLDGERHIIHHVADSLIAATRAERQQLIDFYGADPRKILIVPPGVDLSRFRPLDQKGARRALGIPCSGNNIMFVGRIEPLKGIDTLIEAAAILRQKHPDIMEKTCFSIVGGDPWSLNPEAEMARLKSLRAELGVHDLVGFLGAKNQIELPKYYAAAEVVVMPSHYESFGLVALEAMAMGVPVIASEVGGLAHLVLNNETGFHIPPRDPGALAEKIHLLLTNRSLRDRLAENALEHARGYEWEVIACRLLGHFEKLARYQPVQKTAWLPCV